MKNSLLITFIGFCVALASFARSASEIRDLPSFSSVSAHEGINVYLKPGSKETAEVVINSGNIDLEEVLTEVSGHNLKVHLEDQFRWNKGKLDIDVFVTFKEVNELKASSAGSIELEGTLDANGDFNIDVSSAGAVEASIVGIDELEIEASSSGNVFLSIEADEMEARASSAGKIAIEGTVRKIDVKTSSAGSYKGFDLKSEEVFVSSSSGGGSEVHVTKKIKAKASSGGRIYYEGNPSFVDSNSSSGGRIKKS